MRARFYLYFLWVLGLIVLASCQKKEQEIPVSSVSINKATVDLTIGETVQLSATVAPADATQKTISWSSSNQSVATVDNGKVAAIAEGSASITASCGGKSATCMVSVKKAVVAVTAVVLNKESLSLQKGESEVLIATVKPDDATDKTVTWSSMDSSIADVEQNGKVTAISSGSTTIVAKAGDCTAKCEVTVVSPSLSVLYKTSSGSLTELYTKEGVKENHASSEPGWNEIILEPGITSFKEWFRENNDVNNVVVPEGIESISSSALSMCRNLERVILPESLLTIGASAFHGCIKLPEISIPGKLVSIGFGAFNNCQSLTSITIPDSVESIGEAFLSVCLNLTNINGERFYIRDGTLLAFAPVGITSTTLPEGIERIGENVFAACSELSEIYLPSGLISIGNKAFTEAGLKSVLIPDTVTDLGESAFYGCKQLETITLSNSITSIGWGTFGWCKTLRSLTIPDSVLSIENGAFYVCDNLKYLSLGSGVTTLGGFIVDSCPNLLYINLRSTVPPTIDEGTFDEKPEFTFFVPTANLESYRNATGWSNFATSIYSAPEDGNIVFENDYVKNDCVRVLDQDGDGEISYWEAAGASINDVDYLERRNYSTFNEFRYFRSIRGIPRSFFWNSSQLTEISLPETIKTIGANAFAECWSIQSLTIPSGVTTIDYSAFFNCSSLREIIIPESVVEIGTGILADCSNLESINGGRALIRNNVLLACASKGVPGFDVPSGVLGIEMYAFRGCLDLKTVTVPESVTSIGPWAFERCNNLESITIYATAVPSGGNYMFISNTPYPIFVPVGSLEQYKAAEYWRDYADRIQAIPE